MPMFSTIRGDAVGPFFQGPRLRGTPEDDGYQEPEDDRRRCGLCAQWFAADELTEYRGRMYCEACLESAKERDRREAKAAARDHADDLAEQERKDRGL